LGYHPVVLTNRLCCQARDAGSFLASIALSHAQTNRPLAFLAGGETVVRLTGSGKGGRNQELALSAAGGIAGTENILIFSVGSDGTDGPTDAAGGVVTGSSARQLEKQGIHIHKVLEDNDSYHALDRIGSLIRTGPTGTNVNDLSVVLIGGENR
jgi:hydroxypyruvate reductase